MNFERYRSKDKDLKPDSQQKNKKKPVDIKDATGAYIEKNGNLIEQANLWTEKFRDWYDDKEYGPSSIGIDFEFEDATDVYGIPEHADSLSLKDT